MEKNTVTVPKIKKKVIRNTMVIIFATIIIITVVGIILSRRLTPYMILEYDGYAVANEELTQFLLGGLKDKDENRNISAVKVKDQTYIYKDKNNVFYLGEDRKKRLNIEYPIYINENISLYNMSNDITLITEKYENIEGYANSILVSGNLYNISDLNRADYNDYIFLKNERGIFVNTYDIELETEGKNYKIPMNSIVTFYEDYILYYTLDKTVFVYNEIIDVDPNSNIIIGNNEGISYIDFLKKAKIVNLKKEEEEEEQIEQPILEEVVEEKTEPKIENSEESKEEKKEEVEEIKENEVIETPAEIVDNDNIQVITYVNPEVTVSNWVANIYTANVSINIYDPTHQITTPINFSITQKGKVFMRKAFTSSGLGIISGLFPNENYHVEADYVYKNEDGESIKRVVLDEDFSTKDIKDLNPIGLGFEYGDISANGVNLNNLKITSNIQDESIYGLKQLTFFINKLSYNISSEKIRELKNGNSINYKLTNILKSNQSYDFEIKAYDIAGNELKLTNNKGTIRTSKAAPNLKVNVNTKDLTAVKIKLELTNDDSIKIGNYHYVLYKIDGTVVKEDTLSEETKEFELNNLDPNTVYSIRFYGKYDLEDGKGIKENVELAAKSFTTVPISSLGNVYLKNDVKEITKDSANISLLLSNDKTDQRLVTLLEKVNLTILKDGEKVQTKSLSTEQLNSFKDGEEIVLSFNNLNSITKYTIDISITAVQGEVEEVVKVNYNLKNFITKRNPAEIFIKNKIVTESMIDFDIFIKDEDNSIKSDTVYFELRDDDDKLVQVERININAGYERKNYSRLNPQKTYKMFFYAEEYNEGEDNSTFENNKLLLNIEFFTEFGISGKVQLQNTSKITTGRNLLDASSTIKWYSAVWNTNRYYGNYYYYDRNYGENILRLLSGKSNTTQYYTYDFSDYIGQTVTFSFDARVDENSSSMQAYIQATKTDSDANSRTPISDLSTDWKHYTKTITIDNTGFAGFYLKASSSDKTQYLYLKNIQVEKGRTATAYRDYEYNWISNFIIDLVDNRDEISTNDYYLRIYKQENLLDEFRYIEIDDTNKVEGAVKSFDLEDNQNYQIELLVKINDRFYTIDSLEFTTKSGEVRGISNLNDWLTIQPNGNYVVYNDLDFTGVGSAYRFGGDNIAFNGTIDFKGHKITRSDSLKNFIYITSTNAVLKNFVLDVKIVNSGSVNSFYPFVYHNRGLISNGVFNLVECTPNAHNWVTLCSYRNSGTIEKFIINYKVPFYCSRVCAGLAIYGIGTYTDGYVYGEDIQAIFNMANGEWRDIGGVVYDLERNGVIRNVYSLININCSTSKDYKWYNRTGAIVDTLDRGNVYNVYSLGHGENYYSLSNGPTIGAINGNSKVGNSYYFDSDVIFNNSYNSKGNVLALIDSEFQNQFLNSNRAFNVSIVDNGYFPHLNLSYCMPNQEYIELPKVTDADLPDLLSLEVIDEDAENHELTVAMYIHNPDANSIVNVKVANLTSEIIEQSYDSGKSRVIVKLSNPLTYVSNYSLMSLTFKGTINKNYTVEYKEGEKNISVDFYKNIYNVSDWKEINSAPNQNYRLMNDLNFINESSTIAITKDYTGKIDGNNKTIKNIVLPESYSGCFITKLKGTLKNLNVENYVQTPTVNANRIGLINTAESTAVIDNVHIKGEKLSSSYVTGDVYIGGIVANATQPIITNSSVTDISVNIDSILNTTRIGGICGSSTALRLSNCYVQGINFKIYNVIDNEGIGGIVGRETDYGGWIRYCYSERKN